MAELILPYSEEIEKAVLGGSIMDPKVCLQFSQALRPEWFYRQQYSYIFRVLVAMTSAGKSIDLADLAGELHRRGTLEKCGGPVALATLTDAPSFDVEGCALILRGDYCRRELMRAAIRAQAKAAEPGADSRVIAQEFIEACEEIREGFKAANTGGISEYESLKIVTIGLQDRKASRVKTGIDGVDRLTGGFQPGELVLVTGETGIGKTSFARQIMQYSCDHDAHGLFVSCEMLNEHLTMRKLSGVTEIPLRVLRNGSELTKEQIESIGRAAWRFCKICRIFDESSNISDIKTAAFKMHSEGTLSWLAMDYDELIEAKGRDELERQGNVASMAKWFAMKLGIPVFLISQLRKPLDKQDRQKPTLSRLYGSGAKVKHASTVIYVDREWVRELKGDETAAQVILLKHRDGQVGRIPCRFDVRNLTFSDAAPKQESYQGGE